MEMESKYVENPTTNALINFLDHIFFPGQKPIKLSNQIGTSHDESYKSNWIPNIL